jgi:hypothetical protein
MASLAWLGRALTDGAIDGNIRGPFEVESDRPPEVDARKLRRPDSAKSILLDPDTATLEPRHDAIHAVRVPGLNDVGQQRVHAQDGRHLLPPAASQMGMNAPVVFRQRPSDLGCRGAGSSLADHRLMAFRG